MKKRFLAKEPDSSLEVDLNDYFLRNINPKSKTLINVRVEKVVNLDMQLSKIDKAAPTTLIWKEKKKPRQAYVLERGEYDQKGEPVDRLTPGFLPAFDGYSKDRLGLAQWLVDGNHPLTARVAVNRIWQQFFGTGIVATADDFGSQGELPTHPELLDWLAEDFVASNWDIKRLVKQIVMSMSYRQNSSATSNKVSIDPKNRFLSHGSRYRLDAETLRDQALLVSGLLVPTVGGPGVKPPQPNGLWYAVGYTRSNTVRFKADQGADKVHRRSLYTFWKRTAPPPQMATFDAPSRESCVVRRERTNTPLQALLLMNDPQYVEAARHLAQLTLDQNSDDIESDIEFMYERVMMRSVSKPVLEILKQDLMTSISDFIKRPDEAKELINIGEQPAPEHYDAVQLASLTMLANLLMNQDEFVSKN